MKVLSLFDGMACGYIAFRELCLEPESYIAYEIDKYAVQTSTHNFPKIQHMGDVFKADYSELHDIDYLVGGSPCTYWSIAQTKNRETVASGMGWELFSQYVRALREVKPKFFIYENNKSMSNAIRQSICETFGFEPVCINSALVSAQTRQRLYWVGKRNEDGFYSKVDVELPEDRGILLRDVLDTAIALRDKGRTLISSTGRTTTREYFDKHQSNMVAEPVVGKPLSEKEMDYMVRTSEDGRNHFDFAYFCDGMKDKSPCVTANMSRGVPYNVCAEPIRVGTYPSGERSAFHDSQQCRVYSPDGKSVTLCGNGGGMGAKTGLYAIGVGFRGRMDDGRWQKQYEARDDEKANALTTATTDSMVALPLNTTDDEKSQTIKAQYAKTSVANVCCYSSTYGATGVAEPVVSNALYCAYAIEFDEQGNPTKAISTDGKEYTVYEVKDGQITIKGKTYPIKLVDGFYIIRKLTVSECKRLQTVPDWYEFPVSDSQAYKMLGNGWTVEVIKHLILATLREAVS